MMATLLAWLRGNPSPAPAPDPLRELIARAHITQAEAWEVINARRRERGEPPVTPSWEDLLGLPDEAQERTRRDA